MLDTKSFIARRAARELRNGDVVNLGIGLPTLVPGHLPDGVTVILQSENGIVELGSLAGRELDPLHVTDAGGQPALAAVGGAYVDSATSFAFIRGGHVDATILGALEVDAEGNLANWIIPGKKLPGMGGAMDLVVGARRVIVAMEHSARGLPKILKRCRLPLTAARCVSDIITEMGVMKVTEQGILLTEYNPAYTLEQIREATEAELLIADDLIPMA